MATYDLAYPGAAIDAILNTAYFLQEAGYIFQGSASEYSGTPSKRVWLIAPAGSTGFGLSSAVPQGSIGICLYNGTAWVGKVINVLTLDSQPTRNSQNGVTSGGVAATLDEIAGGIMETFASLLFDDETASADLRTKLSYAVKFSVSDVYQTVTHLNILAATTSKAGLMSAEDKAKVDSFLTNLRSLTFADTTASADQGTQITETLKATIGGVQEVIDSITLLAATSSKAGLLSASDKAYIDALPATLTSLSNSISGALALMQSMMGYYVCDTAAATAAKTVAATGYSLTNGGCIRIKMTNANTADNVTLNINSTGAKALFYDGAQASSTNTWEAGEIISVFYDGTKYMSSNSQGGGNNERTPYYIAKTVNGVYTVLVSDNPSASHYKLDKGGVVRIRMPFVGTGASQLQIGNTDVKDLLYNGQAVSPTNTWGLHEIISVYYDGVQYQASNSENWGKSESLMCKVVSTTDITNSTTIRQQSFFDTTNIGFVKGKKYRVQAFTNTTHAGDVNFFLRDVASSQTVLFNLNILIPVGSIMSSQIIYECNDDSAQYISMWTANKKAASYKIRVEEIEVVNDIEDVAYSEETPMVVQGTVGSDGSFGTSTTRVRTDYIKVDGNFIVSLNTGFFFNVQYYDNNKTWVKAANYSYWLKDGWKDSWNGYIGIAVRNYANTNILPTDLHGLTLKRVARQTLPLYDETYPFELGALSGGFAQKSTAGCRTPFNTFIPIAKGETIECQFHLAQTGGVYGAFYAYMNGVYVAGSGTIVGHNLTINDGTVISVTSDGTFNELRFRVLGSAAWTQQLAEASFVSVTRNSKKVAEYNEGMVRELFHDVYSYQGDITLGKRKFKLDKLWQVDRFTTTTQASCAWNGYLILGDSSSTWRVLNISDGSIVGTISVPVSCHTNTLQFAPTLHNDNTQFPYLYASQFDSPSSFFVFELTMSGSTFTLTLVQTYDTSGLNKSMFGYLNDFAIDFENNFLYSMGYVTNNSEDTNWLYCKFPLTPVSGGDVALTDNDIIEHWSLSGYKFRQDNLFDDGKIYSIAGIFDYNGGHNWLFAVDARTHEKCALLDLAQFTASDEEPEGLFLYNGEAYFLSQRSEGYVILYKMEF